jgi:hypothetical protein
MNKQFKILQCKYKDNFFEIVEDLPNVGWYLRIFNKDMKCIADHLQNDFDSVTDFAFEEYGISKNSWIEK